MAFRFSIFLLCWATIIASSPAVALELSGATTACHDPSHIIKDSQGYWIYSTSTNLRVRRSTDLLNWSNEPRAFSYDDGVPPWMDAILTALEGDVGPWNLWAPEIIAYNNVYYLYYSRNMYDGISIEISGCGVAIGTSLSLRDWTDQGAVITTDLYEDHFRVIDPTLIFDQQNRLWMAVGSFGSPDGSGYLNGGIRVIELNPATGKRINESDTGTRIAGSWIEAPYLIYHNGYYYLFFNQGECCSGTNSTYYIRAGRSSTITGPYVDMLGDGLLQDEQGGSLFMGRDKTANYTSGVPNDNFGSVGREIGPGHVGVLEGEDGFDRFTYHYYDADTPWGEPTLGLRTLIWTESGWPRPGWELPDGNYAIASQLGDESSAPYGDYFIDLLYETTTKPVVRSWDGSPSQIWNIERVGMNEYRILSRRTGLALIAAGDGEVVTAEYDGEMDAHRWFIEQTSDRSFRLINRGTQEALEFSNGKIGTSPWNHDTGQRWWISPTGIYTLTNDYSLLAAGAPDSNPGSQVEQNAYYESPLQQWRLIPLKQGFTRFENLGSGLVLGLRNESLLEEAAIEQQTETGAQTQAWSIETLPDGSSRIINRSSSMVMDIPSLAPYTQAEQIRWLHVRNQQWTLNLLHPSPLALDPEPDRFGSDFWLVY